MAKKLFRRRLIIDPEVQGEMVQRVLFHWGSFLTVALISLYLIEVFIEQTEATPLQRLDSIWSKYCVIVPLFLLAIPWFVYDTLRWSRRIVGPMYRLRQAMQHVTDGDEFEELRFRDTDFWKDRADEFNEMMAQFETAPEIEEQTQPAHGSPNSPKNTSLH